MGGGDSSPPPEPRTLPSQAAGLSSTGFPHGVPLAKDPSQPVDLVMSLDSVSDQTSLVRLSASH